MRTTSLIAAILLAPTGFIQAQESTLRSEGWDARPEGREATVPDAAFLIDAPVDRSTYTVGPRDLLAISVLGDLNLLYELPVTPEGMLVVPTAGVIPVLGLTLEEAEGRVRERFLRYYRNVDIHLTLSEVRIFKVYVVGDVPDPGPRVASSVTRVSELVPDPAVFSRRNIVLQRAIGDTILVDLTRFSHTGDMRYNPTVREGDTILVPGVDEAVHVYGRVFFPGSYEFRRGETLSELLEIANGYRGFPSDAHDVVRVSRFVSRDEREFFSFSRTEATEPKGESFVLQPFDAVYVPGIGNYKEQKTATITGEIVYPGTYPIRPDTTRVLDLIEMAGGVTPDASLGSAQLRRAPAGVEEEGLEQLGRIPLELLTEEERQILFIRQRADDKNVVIDFEKLLEERDEAYNLTLRDGDNLLVPERREGVTVLGAVLEPGIVEHAPGRSVEEYVDLAGGYSEGADEDDLVVLKAKLGNRLEREDVHVVEGGDTIVVPFEEEKDWLAIFDTTAGVIGSVASIILAIIVASR